MSENSSPDDLLAYTTEIASAYFSQNTVSHADIPRVIEQIHQSLLGLCGEKREEKGRPLPAVPIKRSITPDYLVCLEDGKKLKMLKRYLKTSYDMSPEDYRERWGLPHDYPMVAPNYAKKRSQLAKDIGLGTKAKG